MPKALSKSQVIHDAETNNWVDRFAPVLFKPYLKLARFDRPIGIWLLFWPGAWAIAMAGSYPAYPNLYYLGLFFLGSIILRGAGCAFNDIVDRNYDSKVERTSRRPIPSGQITVQRAYIFLLILLIAGLAILMQFNLLTIWVGMVSLILVVIYPFMKRFTYWPQAFLGSTFNWGALLGWAAITGTLEWAAFFLYLGGVFWTIGYDTIYAHQDKADDILAGVKSTALKFGENTRAWLFVFYGLALGFFFLAGFNYGLSRVYYVGLAFCFFHFHAQIWTLDIHDQKACLKSFKANNLIGLVLFLSIWAGKVT